QQTISDVDIARIMQLRMQEVIGADTVDANRDIEYVIVPRHAEFLFMVGGYGVTRYFDATLEVTSNIGVDAKLQGDTFGVMQDHPNSTNFNNGLPNVFSTSLNPLLNRSRERGFDNANQGIFIDDLIIGFAERGEMVTNASAGGTGFEDNPNALLIDTFEGEYQLELREGTEYVFAGGSFISERYAATVWDTNVRFVQGHSVSVPAGESIPHNSRLEVSDGVDTIVFRFYNLDSETAANPAPTAMDDEADGVYTIGYRPTMSQADIARALSTAINDTVGHDDRDLIESTRTFGVIARVNAAISENTTSGQVDLSPKSPYSDEVIVGLLGTSNLGVLQYEEDADKIDTSDPSDDTTIDTGLDGRTIPGYIEFNAHGQIGDNPFSFDPLDPFKNADVDLYSAYVGLDGTITANLDPRTLQNPLSSLIRLFYVDSSGNVTEVAQSALGDTELSYSVADTSEVGRYVVAISHFANNAFDPEIAIDVADPNRVYTDEKFEYDLKISVDDGSESPFQFGGEWNFDLEGDQNSFRDQGQIIISSNRVSNSLEWGILVDASPRDTSVNGGENLPHQGATRNFLEINSDHLATGVTIVNNIVYNNGDGAIRFSGDAAPATQAPGSVPVGRIINNTLYGNASGDVGIQIDDQAGPTIVNNIVANFDVGIDIENDGVSPTHTRISRTLFQSNNNNAGGAGTTGQEPILLGDNDPLFVNPSVGNFYLMDGSEAIDAAFDSIFDRTEFNTLNAPLGIATSPVKAPERDQSGQVRYDDPNVVSNGGVGENAFKDIGALDRADTRGPSAVLVVPQDNDAANLDLDPTPDVIQLLEGPLANISLQLLDTSGLTNQPQGSGIDDSTVTGQSIIVQEISSDAVTTLVEGVDYRFDYDTTN
ncbi:MAG: right-handed parallel beta-helix repeat-containing protein, partial [Blastopirellula sp. JB062]